MLLCTLSQGWFTEILQLQYLKRFNYRHVAARQGVQSLYECMLSTSRWDTCGWVWLGSEPESRLGCKQKYPVPTQGRRSGVLLHVKLLPQRLLRPKQERHKLQTIPETFRAPCRLSGSERVLILEINDSYDNSDSLFPASWLFGSCQQAAMKGHM